MNSNLFLPLIIWWHYKAYNQRCPVTLQMKSTNIENVSSFIFSETATKHKPTFSVITVEEFLKLNYISFQNFGNDNLRKEGIYKLNGWAFDFRPFMKRYLVNQYGQWQEYYAPNKSLLRKSTYGKITEIIEK